MNKKFFDPITRVEEFVLDNGLKLLVYNDPSMIGVYIALNFYSGSFEDKISGEAHFLEHVTIHPTVGDEHEEHHFVFNMNATGTPVRATDYDDTLYSVLVPFPKLHQAAQYLFDITFNLPLPLKDIEKQRKIIVRELIEECDELAYSRKVDEVQWTQIFAGTPYEKLFSVLGTKKSINAITEDDLITFRNTHYVPSNAVLIIVSNSSPYSIYKTLNTCEISNKNVLRKQRTSLKLSLPQNREIITRELKTSECVREVSGNCMITVNSIIPYAYDNVWAYSLFESKAHELIRENQHQVYSVSATRDLIALYDFFTVRILVDATKKHKTKKSQQLIESLFELKDSDQQLFERIRQRELNAHLLRRWLPEDIVDYLIKLHDPDYCHQKTITAQYSLDSDITYDSFKNKTWPSYFNTNIHFCLVKYQ
jgi:predicted Zn-dependent peptidase